MKSTKFPTLLTILALSCSWHAYIYATDCKLDDFDLSALDRTWISMSADGNVTYKISLCSALPNGQSDPHSCHAGTAVCMIHKNGTVLSMGNFSSSQVIGVANMELGEVWIYMAGDPCLENPSENMTTGINMKCGPTLGSPKFLNYDYCVTNFEWESNVYCTGSQRAQKEVPCYVYDAHGHKYDLSPLAKKTGGYTAASAGNTEVYINVCRDIAAGAIETQSCPSRSSACRIVNNAALGIGEPREPLKLATDGSLYLHYTTDSSKTTDGCTSPPSTTVKFVCPKRGGSRDPLVIDDFDCQYVIEWQTEYACPESSLINDTCVLTKEDADIDIDLRPLTNPPDANDPYKASYTDNNNTYVYYLNVCGGLNIPCPDDSERADTPVCQTELSDINFGHKMGSLDHTQLRYADGDLTLTYKGGELCHHNQFRRWTIINFICNMTADNGGRGHPEFNTEDDCMYFFDWQTKYACFEHPVGEMCRVDYQGKRFDLSSLVRTKDTNWVALHETTSEDGGQGMYFVNVCHDVLSTGPADGCPAGAAACYKRGHVIHNLGRYSEAPTYDSAAKSIQLKYTKGGICSNNNRISSIITFICKPGDLQTGPTLIRVSPDKCLYEFEWYTAAACVLGHYEGANCKVYDEDAGFSFDLSRLKLTDNQPPYSVEDDTGAYEYQMNVCGPVSGTKCDNSIANPGICQSKKNDPAAASFVTGQYSEKMTYYDGMINLTYMGGSPYHDDAHTPRKSEIAFLCDPNAENNGVGKPTYLTETNKTYGFEWYTAYACPSQPLECTATDGTLNQQYDLSSLSLTADQGNWVQKGIDGKKYFINVCRSLNNVPVQSGCGAFAAVCRTKMDSGHEVLDLVNMGEVSSGLEVVSEGQLKLTYVGPKTCNNGSTILPYKTNIEFLCEKSAITPTGETTSMNPPSGVKGTTRSHGSSCRQLRNLNSTQLSTPGAPRQDGPCEYTIIWNTVHACPLVEDLDQGNCTAKDPNSNYVFNLQPLTRPGNDPYVINSTDGSVFKINICGDIAASECWEKTGVCQVAADGVKNNLASSNNKLDVSETGRMTLVYNGITRLDNGDVVEVEINFICSPDVDLGHPMFLRKEAHAYIFEFTTALACAPMPIDCFVQDSKGNQYDLGTLSNANGFSVVDTRNDDTKYFINVCRPVNNMPGGEQCKNEPIGGCQVASNGVSYNMGYIQSKPIAAADGTLTLHYRNGDVCHKGKANEAHRSTRINFFCSGTEGSPVFEAETELCEYIFTWRTQAACPLTNSTGADCKVVDPRYNYQFDLSPLRKIDEDYHVPKDEYVYLINVCGPLVKPGSCDQPTGAAACQTKPSDSTFMPVIAGKSSSELRYLDGELSLTYKEGRGNCHGQYTRQTIITFTCDQDKDGTDGPLFIEESENCHYLFRWATKYACPPFKVGPCATSDGTNSYDLSSLSRTETNYELTDPDNNKKRYILNVCRSLIHKKNATCPYNSAVCMVDLDKPSSDHDKYQNIGEPGNHQILYDNGHVVIVYDSGGNCSNGKDLYMTHINFICDKNAVVSSPTDHFMVGDCDHHFTWTTAAACALGGGGGGGTTPPSYGSCTVANPLTGYIFNLQSLTVHSGPMWSVDDEHGHQFEFNVCGPATRTSCHNASSQIGVCQSEKEGDKRTFNAGNVASNLEFDDGVLALNYTGGDPCHGGQFKRNTVFNFVCNKDAVGHPVYIDETDDCTYYFAWHTNLACENEIKCTVDVGDSNEIDLSTLSDTPYHLVHSGSQDAAFYLSVCRPLIPIKGVLCPAGSSVCKVKAAGETGYRSLGKPRSPPTYNADTGEVTLLYTSGDNCTSDPSQKYTSEIVFACKVGPDQGSPLLVWQVGCHYVFHWDTNAMCFGKSVLPSNSCAYKDPQTGAEYNLTTLQRQEPYQVTHGKQKYLVNMCAPADPKSTSVCHEAMVCLDGAAPLSYGMPKDIEVQRTENMLKLTYAAGGQCADGKADSHILLQCDREAGDGQPQFFTGMGCYVVFLWKTSVVCPPVRNQCAFSNEGHLYDLSLLSMDAGSWNVTDTAGNRYWINVCGAIHKGPGSECSPSAGACRKSKDGRVDALGMASSQKDLYLKDGLIMLEYPEGGPACSGSRRRSDNSAAKTIIKFKCGTTYGGPKYVDSKDNTENCIFEFSWETKLACKVEREPVTSIGGVIKDPRSGGAVDLRPIMSKSYTMSKKSGSSVVKYTIRLDGNMTDCLDGVVCSQPSGQSDTRLLGGFHGRKFHMNDDVLEAVYTSPKPCGGEQGHKNISSVIQFHCNTAINNSGPVLEYKSGDCFYVFTWHTKVACLSAKVKIPLPGTGTSSGGGVNTGVGGNAAASGKGGGLKGKTIAGIVGVFFAVIVLCILLVVFHKPERRAACFSAVRRAIRHRSSQYTQLPQNADDLQGEEDILDFLDAAETESSRDDHTSVVVASETRGPDPVTMTTLPSSYHDDSDEDPLLA